MWRETNMFGIYLPPLLAYAAVALLLWLPLHYLLVWMRLDRWLNNPSVAQITAYLCVLAALVTWF